MGAFADSVKNNAARVKKEINTQVYAQAFDLFVSLVITSPTQPLARFAKGHLINNWFPAVGGFDSMTNDSTDLGGSASLTRINSLMGGAEFLGRDGLITISNSVSYAYQAEHVGWARTPAYHWVQNAITNTWIAKYTQ